MVDIFIVDLPDCVKIMVGGIRDLKFRIKYIILLNLTLM